MLSTNPVIDTLNATLPRQHSPTEELDKTAFLTLLVTQLRHQDPINPMQSEQFMGQLAQFNQLEQSINLNRNFEEFQDIQALTQASSLIGKEVVALSFGENEEAGLVKGSVEEVILYNGNPILKLSSGEEVPIQAVVSVGARSIED